MNRIQTFRERHGLSQYALADMLGVAQPTISRWEAGIHEPTKRDLIAIDSLDKTLQENERRVSTPSPALPAGVEGSHQRRPVPVG